MTLGGPWLATVSEESAASTTASRRSRPGLTASWPSALSPVDMSITAQASAEEKAAAEKFFSWFYQKENMVTWSLASGWPPLTSEVTAEDVRRTPSCRPH